MGFQPLGSICRLKMKAAVRVTGSPQPPQKRRHCSLANQAALPPPPAPASPDSGVRVTIRCLPLSSYCILCPFDGSRTIFLVRTAPPCAMSAFGPSMAVQSLQESKSGNNFVELPPSPMQEQVAPRTARHIVDGQGVGAYDASLALCRGPTDEDYPDLSWRTVNALQTRISPISRCMLLLRRAKHR